MGGTETFAKMFTVDEANVVLPRIVPDVEELLATFREIREEIESESSADGLPVSPGSSLGGRTRSSPIARSLASRTHQGRG